MAAAIVYYRHYWYCPPDDLLVDTAAYLSEISNQAGDADHQRLIDHLEDADGHTPIRLTQTELAAHQRIVEQLTAIADAPIPSPAPAQREGGDDARR